MLQSVRAAIKTRLSPSIFPVWLACSPLLPPGTLNRASKLKSPISVRCNIRVIANTRCAHNCPLLDLPLPLLFLYSPRAACTEDRAIPPSQFNAHLVDLTRGAIQRAVFTQDNVAASFSSSAPGSAFRAAILSPFDGTYARGSRSLASFAARFRRIRLVFDLSVNGGSVNEEYRVGVFRVLWFPIFEGP